MGELRSIEGGGQPSAHERSRVLLEEAERGLRSWSEAEHIRPDVAVLAQLGAAWATLALLEPAPGSPLELALELEHDPMRFEHCPVCGTDETVHMPTDWEAAVAAGACVPIVGCGNPWHYVFPG